MNKKILIFVLLLSFICKAYSQKYLKEAGIRGGIPSGITCRQYLNEYLSYEGILSFRKSGIQLTLIRQVHEMNADFNLAPTIHFLYGMGGHLGFFFSDQYHAFWRSELYYDKRKFTPVLGLDAYAALEYRLQDLPFTIGVDYKPFFEFSVYEFFNLRLTDLAFNIKYRF